MKRFLLVVALLGACKSDSPRQAVPQLAPPQPMVREPAPGSGSDAADPTLATEQADYVADVVEFMATAPPPSKPMTAEEVRARMKKGSEPLKDEWNAWEKEGPMTPDRITNFYKQTANYIFELAEWHLWVPDKRVSDLQMVKDLVAAKPKNVLDFGGGVGMLAFPLARAGLDVTLADLDSTSLSFAKMRRDKRNIPMKLWKTDVEPMPPDAKYDVIVALDVLEHLPKDVLKQSVDKLIQLKHAKTQVILNAPFGRTAVHPMHLDADEETFAQVKRLQTELPPE